MGTVIHHIKICGKLLKQYVQKLREQKIYFKGENLRSVTSGIDRCDVIYNW